MGLKKLNKGTSENVKHTCKWNPRRKRETKRTEILWQEIIVKNLQKL